MRKPIAATLLALMAVAGCSAGPSADDAPSEPVRQALSEEDLYLKQVRESGYVDDVSDEALLLAGHEVCAALDRGVEPIEVLALSVETGSEAGAVIMGTSVAILCRQHLEAVRRLSE